MPAAIRCSNSDLRLIGAADGAVVWEHVFEGSSRHLRGVESEGIGSITMGLAREVGASFEPGPAASASATKEIR